MRRSGQGYDKRWKENERNLSLLSTSSIHHYEPMILGVNVFLFFSHCPVVYVNIICHIRCAHTLLLSIAFNVLCGGLGHGSLHKSMTYLGLGLVRFNAPLDTQ